MNKYTEFIKDLKEFQDIITEKHNGKLTHSYMLICKDNLLMDIFAKNLAALILCEEGDVCESCDNCTKVFAGTHPDMFVYPKDKDVKKDDINDIREHINYKPFEARGKVFLLNNFSSANDTSQNKLLKSLENPPDNTYFILCVNNEIPVLPTIFSRCKKIYLPLLAREKVEEFLTKYQKSPKAKSLSYIADGSLTKAVNFAENNVYMQNYELVLEVLSKLTKSSTMLPLCAKLYAKAAYFEDILEIMESMLEDILYIRLNKKALISNQNVQADLERIAQEYTADAVDLIIKKIYETRKQIDFNCSKNSLIDNLLLYMLEVKYLCK